MKKYHVVLKRNIDWTSFRSYLLSNYFNIVHNRRFSRSFVMELTENQANTLSSNSSVEVVSEVYEGLSALPSDNVFSGDFWKGGLTVSDQYRQWGQLHVAGDETQRRKGVWGLGYAEDGSDDNILVNDTVEAFNSGEHVDIVVCDTIIGHDCEEWYSPTTGTTRFVQYEWFNELNQYISDDPLLDGYPVGNVPDTFYPIQTDVQEYHGTHVMSTIAGQFYGWAKEANFIFLPCD